MKKIDKLMDDLITSVVLRDLADSVIENDDEFCEQLRALNLGNAYEIFEKKYTEDFKKARRIAVLESKIANRLMDGDTDDAMLVAQAEVDKGNIEIALAAIHKLLDEAEETQKIIRDVIEHGNNILKTLSHYCQNEDSAPL